MNDSNGDIFKLKKKHIKYEMLKTNLEYAEMRVSKMNFMPFNLDSNLTLDSLWILMYIKIR